MDQIETLTFDKTDLKNEIQNLKQANEFLKAKVVDKTLNEQLELQNQMCKYE